jgi:transcriptional regulator with XRE-family HTH domain
MSKFTYDKQEFIKARFNKLLSASEVANLANISLSSLYQMELGNHASPRTIRLVSEALGFKPTFVFDSDQPSVAPSEKKAGDKKSK